MLTILMTLTCIPAANLFGGAFLSQLTPAEQYQALVKTQQKAEMDFNEAYNAAKTADERQKLVPRAKWSPQDFAGQFLALANKFPMDPAAFDACHWLLTRAGYTNEAEAAVDLLIRDWIKHEKLANICKSLTYYSAGPRDRLLRAAVEKSPHRAVRGFALYSLATSLRGAADLQASGDPERAGPLSEEAEQILQQVVDGYADLKHLTTLGEAAKADLFEIRNLGIGKTVPTIEGEDLDGKAFKLNDYRGKVVLLVFWGTWCGPCMAELPHEQELFKMYAAKSFAVVGVNSDEDQAAARKACADKGITWRSFWAGGTGGSIPRQWNIRGWPTLYVFC